MMKINKVYNFFDEKYSPITGYFFVSPVGEIEDCLINLKNKCGTMRDYFGYEYEENDSVTFYDFTGKSEKAINVSVSDLLIILQPLISEYLSDFPDKREFIESILNSIKTS
ncbi:MAG: hypothetical protein M3512_15665 [Bacteroidota bacterium]|nr:hypothetical protein [Bacteroidota bacterium]